jgi:hypothetical protein
MDGRKRKRAVDPPIIAYYGSDTAFGKLLAGERE